MRYEHDTGLNRSDARWQQGQEQAKISIERYHYLCAALQCKYIIKQVLATDSMHRAVYDGRGLVFDAYTAYPLKPVYGIKWSSGLDGACSPQVMHCCVQAYERSWKCMEGEILYMVAEQQEFWHMMRNYNSPNGTMGRSAWDELFVRLKQTGYDKGIIPCMVGDAIKYAVYHGY